MTYVFMVYQKIDSRYGTDLWIYGILSKEKIAKDICEGEKDMFYEKIEIDTVTNLYLSESCTVPVY